MQKTEVAAIVGGVLLSAFFRRNLSKDQNDGEIPVQLHNQTVETGMHHL